MTRPATNETVTTSLATSVLSQNGPRGESKAEYVYFPDYRHVNTVLTPASTYGFRELRRGRLAPLPYYRAKTTTREPSGSLVEIHSGGSYGWPPTPPEHFVYLNVQGVTPWGPLAAPRIDIDEAISTLDSVAVTALLNELKDSKFNGVVAYAEADQAYKLIGDSATKIASVLVHLRHGRLRSAASELGLKSSKRAEGRIRGLHRRLKNNDDIDRLMSNGILQVQYGIKPLLSDVAGAAETLAQKTSQEIINECKVRKNTTIHKVTTRKDDLYSVNRDMVVSIKIGYGLDFEISNPILHTLAQLGVTNPALLVWEKLPWSFVIDWFLPIGNHLSSLDATLGMQFKSGWKSVRLTVSDYENQATFLLLPSNGSMQGKLARSYEHDSFQRTVLSGFPMPTYPRFKNPFSLEHALNGLALLSGFRKRAYFKTP